MTIQNCNSKHCISWLKPTSDSCRKKIYVCIHPALGLAQLHVQPRYLGSSLAFPLLPVVLLWVLLHQGLGTSLGPWLFGACCVLISQSFSTDCHLPVIQCHTILVSASGIICPVTPPWQSPLWEQSWLLFVSSNRCKLLRKGTMSCGFLVFSVCTQ